MPRSANRTQGFLEAKIDFIERSFTFSGDSVGKQYTFLFHGCAFCLCLTNFDFAKSGDFDHPLPTFAGTKVCLNWLPKRRDYTGFGDVSSWDGNNEAVLSFNAREFIIRSKVQ